MYYLVFVGLFGIGKIIIVWVVVKIYCGFGLLKWENICEVYCVDFIG